MWQENYAADFEEGCRTTMSSSLLHFHLITAHILVSDDVEDVIARTGTGTDQRFLLIMTLLQYSLVCI